MLEDNLPTPYTQASGSWRCMRRLYSLALITAAALVTLPVLAQVQPNARRSLQEASPAEPLPVVNSSLLRSPAANFLSLPNAWQSRLNLGVAERLQGNLTASITLLIDARRSATNEVDAAHAAGELGVTYLQAQRFAEAEEPLLAAYAGQTSEARGQAANDLGNLALARKQNDVADRYYREASTLTTVNSPLASIATLNLARLTPSAQRLTQLEKLLPTLARLSDLHARAQMLLNLGSQAQKLGPGGTALAYQGLAQASVLAEDTQDVRLQLEIGDALSELYETAKRWEDVIVLTNRELERVRDHPVTPLRELLLQLEWRKGRALMATRHEDQALAAYQRAVEHAQAIRQDLPIELADGHSSYQAILEPLHIGYVELMLNSLARQPAERQPKVLESVRDAVETLRQAEMQDFLGDRCSVEGAGQGVRLEPGVAALYPILLNDRIELLLDTAQGLSRYSVPVTGANLRRLARDLASSLRNGDSDYLIPSRKLYDALIRPIDTNLVSKHIHTLVVVADGDLRLVPFAALHNGDMFLIEQFAIAAVTGMSMTNTADAQGKALQSLMAGVAEPGPVVDRLAATDMLNGVGRTSRGLPAGAGTALMKGRSLRSVPVTELGTTTREASAAAFKKSLALPGVADELNSLRKMLKGSVLIDDTFTVNHFRDEAETGSYRVVHIASHGIFGGSAETSFILAYDDLLGINRLQTLLQSEKLQRNPIELLTLSACETAEGNDRAPLGISGAAIRAKAKSVLGTLWPVEDTAARVTMEAFYAGISSGNLSKAVALQVAQRKLIKNPLYEHPFFWAPFTLIGNWR